MLDKELWTVSTVPDRIKAIRKERGYTQKELGRLSGINEANIRKYESGAIKNPSYKTLKKIAEALDVPTPYLFATESNSSVFTDAYMYKTFGGALADHEDRKNGELAQKILQDEGINYLSNLDEYIPFLNSNGMSCHGEIYSHGDGYDLTIIEYKGKKYEVHNDDLITKRIQLSKESIDKIIENLVTSFKEI